MKTLGLDIGTTTISAVILEDGAVLAVRNVKNDSFVPGESWEQLQDPEHIWRISREIVTELLQVHPDTAAIGLTGQMHGIVYVDDQGNSVSPLYTWQDGRGEIHYDTHTTWAGRLTALTGYSLATGYGLVTHYYNLSKGIVPSNAKKLCTIMDYVAMKLANRKIPVIDSTNAASLGVFHAESKCFDLQALEKAGIDGAILPEVVAYPNLGTGAFGIPVFVAIGDNQASFLGATEGRRDVLLVNVGTGSQVSVFASEYMKTETLETRPYPNGGWLLVGASLCGGRSYALLENFFRQTVKMVTGTEESAYSAMEQALNEAGPMENIPVTVTTFQGTRKNPNLRGSISGIDTENFTPVHLMHSVMRGMAEELYGMYREYLDQGGRPCETMIGSGNGLRRNRYLCRVFEEVFGCRLILSEWEEEAACGAAVYAGMHLIAGEL